MVSYEELIYNFVDIYLKTAVECSICKENYTMGDDTEFLDEYMKFFESLLLSVDSDKDLELETVRKTLEKKKREKVLEFQSFLKRKIIETAVEAADKTEGHGESLADSDMYIKSIQGAYANIFDEASAAVKDSPVELLRYVRTKEENL